jgi:hypothetical protein
MIKNQKLDSKMIKLSRHHSNMKIRTRPKQYDHNISKNTA